MSAVRIRAYLISASLLGAMLWPLTWPLGPRDSFPFSNYPMFAFGRDKPVIQLAHVLARGADGELRPVKSKLTANGTVMQAFMSIRREVHEGRQKRLCRRIAERLAALPGQKPVEVLVAESRFDTLAYFEGARAPLWRRIRARCPVQASEGRATDSEATR